MSTKQILRATHGRRKQFPLTVRLWCNKLGKKRNYSLRWHSQKFNKQYGLHLPYAARKLKARLAMAQYAH